MSAFQYGMKQSSEIYAHTSEQKVRVHTHTGIYQNNTYSAAITFVILLN